MRRLGAGVVLLVALSGDPLARPAQAGLPGYFEWVLWEETEAVSGGASPTDTRRAFRWVVGPYSRLADCEADRDRRAARASPPGWLSRCGFSACPTP